MTELEASKLDQAIAVEAMGWKLDAEINGDPLWVRAWRHDERYPNDDDKFAAECIRGDRGDTCGCWMPSSDIAVAWRVVDEMKRRGWSLSLTFIAVEDEWIAHFFKGDVQTDETGDTAPEAICRAALAALRSTSAPALSGF